MSLSPAARCYLLHAALLTGALGIGALFYNLTINALGYERIFLGRLETISRLVVLRSGLFNLGVPLYDAFAMERSRPAVRPVAIGLVNGGYAAGYLVAPTISTSVQQGAGFAPLFVATACCYGVAALLMLALFGSRATFREA